MTRCMILTLGFFERMEIVDDSILVEHRMTRFFITHWRFKVLVMKGYEGGLIIKDQEMY